MRTLVIAIALSAAATSLVAPAQGSPPASPPVDAPDGRWCGYAATVDPSPGAADDTMTGPINGGPLVWDRPFWLHCTLRVNWNTHGASTQAAHVEAASSPHDGDASTPEVVVLSDRVTYESPDDAQDYLCTSVSWPTATGPNRLYAVPTSAGSDGLPATHDDVAAHWSASPSVPCSGAQQYAWDPSPIDVDATVCPELAKAHALLDPPPASGPGPDDLVYVDAEGDVFVNDGDGISEADWRDELLFDCPAYVDWSSSPYQPGADGYPVIDVGAPPRRVRSAVLGYVAVTMRDGDAQPAVSLAGELAVPALWQCSATPYVATQPFTVTCDPTYAADLGWDCGVLHADVTTTTPGAAARAELHCDADATPEVKTHTVTGVGGHDSHVAPAVPPRVVTRLRCTLTNGLGAAPVPGFAAGCGDPGAARYE